LRFKFIRLPPIFSEKAAQIIKSLHDFIQRSHADRKIFFILSGCYYVEGTTTISHNLSLLSAAEPQRTQRCAGFSSAVEGRAKGKVFSKLAVTEALFA
jgi:hypothetical protein